jgi:hypothetical protein
MEKPPFGKINWQAGIGSMSRTKRSKNIKYKFFRDPKTKNTQTAEFYASAELEQAGFAIPNRLTARANPTSGKVPTSYDDLNIASYHEMDYRKGKGLN